MRVELSCSPDTLGEFHKFAEFVQGLPFSNEAEIDMSGCDNRVIEDVDLP